MNYSIQKIFPEITEKKLQEAILSQGILKTYSSDEIIMDYGKFITSMPLVLEGGLRILRVDEDGNEVFLYFLNPGETCAMSLTCCMAHLKSEIKAIAEEDTKLILIPISFIEEWMRIYPSWKNFVMLSYRKRFNEMLHTIDSIAFEQLDHRLIKYLTEKAQLTNQTTLNITHQEIARELNSSREAISRLLKKLENKERIRLGRNKVTLLKLSEEQ